MRIYQVIAAAGLVAFGLNGATAQQSRWEKIAQRLGSNSLQGTPAEEDAPAPAPAAVPDKSPAVANVPEGSVVPEEEGSLIPTIGLPMIGEKKNKPQINFGKESEEAPQSLTDLFNKPEVKSMLGENPRFVYSANDRPDPMIFPPVRNAAIYMELNTAAELLIEEGNYRGALELYNRILEMKDRRYVVEVRSKVAEIQAKIGEIASASNGETIYELPEWVRDNTKGILLDPSKPMCLVGDFLLKQGDSIPNYPEVRIASIEKETVTYQISGQSFSVTVKGYEE